VAVGCGVVLQVPGSGGPPPKMSFITFWAMCCILHEHELHSSEGRGGALIHVFDPLVSPRAKRPLDRFVRFLYRSPVCPTHRRTETYRPRYVSTCNICSNRPHLIHCVQAMRPKMHCKLASIVWNVWTKALCNAI